MDIRNILGKLDQLTEGTMASAKKKDTGPKFTGKMKGTDPASAAKDKYVGEGSILRDLEAKLNEEPEKRDLMKEFREFKEGATGAKPGWMLRQDPALAKKLKDQQARKKYVPGKPTPNKEQSVEEARAATASFRAGNAKRANLNAMSDEERRAYDKEQQEKQRKRDDARLERERQKLAAKKGVVKESAENLNIGDPVIIAGPVMYEGSTGEIADFTRDKRFVVVNLYNHGTHSFHSADVQFNDYANSDDEEARMHDAGELRDELDESFSDLELAVMEGGHELISENPVAPVQPGKPTLGADLSKPAGQQNAQQQPDQQAQQLAAQKEKQQQATLQKGVNDLKAAGAAVSNPAQVVKAFDKAEDNQGLTPGDKNSIASAGTVLAPIMANPQLQGKFKDLVTQASAAQKKEQQQQAQQPNAVGQVK